MSVIRLCSVIGLVTIAVPQVARADISKEACLDAHSRAQDEQEKGHVSVARKLFLQCAQSACPQLVQADCAEAANDLGRTQPTITFAARDTAGNDLPDTTVYLDDVLIITRLDDGKPHDVDPGTHTVKFSNAGRDQVVTVVVGSGERGRNVVGTFKSDASPPPSTGPNATPIAPVRETPPPAEVTSHPGGAKALLIAGGVLMAAGAGAVVWAITRVPGNCSLSSHECLAPPGDPVFDRAKDAVGILNIGLVVGAAGTPAVVGGLIW